MMATSKGTSASAKQDETVNVTPADVKPTIDREHERDEPRPLKRGGTPSIGDTVSVLVTPVEGRGSEQATGKVTAVHGQRPDGAHTVDILIGEDQPERTVLTSVGLFDDEAGARNAGVHSAFWPALDTDTPPPADDERDA